MLSGLWWVQISEIQLPTPQGVQVSILRPVIIDSWGEYTIIVFPYKKYGFGSMRPQLGAGEFLKLCSGLSAVHISV